MTTPAEPKKNKLELADLERIYTEAEECDKETFAEMRSNLLLISGEHYQKKTAAFFERLKTTKDLSEQTKLRITKNHIQKITKTYTNNIISLAPGVMCGPKNKDEIQDQKAAELNQAVWMDLKQRHDFRNLVDEWGDDFVGIAEVATKIFWDPNAGEIKSFNQKVDEQGQPIFTDPQGAETPSPVDERGQPHEATSGTPNFTGDLVFEPILGFNLLRSPDCKDLKKSPYLIIRKMTDIEEAKAQFPDHAEKIQASMDETMLVFDANKGAYGRAKNQVMIKEIYYRPCMNYPKGYYYFWSKEVKLTEGELPGGVFPIRYQYFDKMQTSPRGRGAVKTMRPYQIEINRAASKIAEHHVTLGDDKLLIQNGTKISAGSALPGVRSVNYTGMAPGVLAGRDGSQYLAYMQAQIIELYEVMNVAEDSAENQTGMLDPYALLHRSATQKKKFSRYVRRFESFLIDVAETALELAKIHMPDDAVVYAVGRKEQVNLSEFRNTTKQCYQITIEAQSEDIESKLGQQMVLNHALQYVGNKLEKEDIGKLMRMMPYGNFDESFSDMTIDYDSGTNLILALDRGQQPQVGQYDNFVYLIKRFTNRVRMADFLSLPPNVQQNYQGIIGQLTQMEAQRVAQIQAAKDGFIPTGGYMVVIDLYVADPKDPLKTRRARVPYESITWLIQKLETQGSSLDDLEKMNEGAMAQIAQGLPTNTQPGPNGMGPQHAPTGEGSPVGVQNGSTGNLQRTG